MKTAIVAFTLGTVALVAFAQDPPSIPDAAKRPQEESKERRDQPGSEEDRVARMKHKIAELQKAGKNEEAERLIREVYAIVEKRQARDKERSKDEPKKRPDGEHSDQHREKGWPEGPERLRHLQEAIRHLHAAGLHEPARDLENAAGKMRENLERERREARDHGTHAAAGEHREREGAEGWRPDGGGNAAPMREMHRQLQEMREQMQKMARELQELREQSRRQ